MSQNGEANPLEITKEEFDMPATVGKPDRRMQCLYGRMCLRDKVLTVWHINLFVNVN